MPFYDYQCESCGTEFEIQRSMTDTSKVKCEACKSVRTTKIFGATGIHFKGSGFYVTDSKGNGSNSASKIGANGDAKASDKPKAEPASKTEKKADSSTKSSAKKTTAPAGKAK